jgi:hypothetical protein
MSWLAAAPPQFVGLSSCMRVTADPMRYSISRSMIEKSRHLIFVETCFDELPGNIRRQGPWQHLKTGEFVYLRPEYQRALTKVGYIIVEQSAGVFSAETQRE